MKRLTFMGLLISFITEFLLYRNHSTDLQRKSMVWFLHDRDHRHETVNPFQANFSFLYPLKTLKTRGLLIFSGSRERGKFVEIG